MRKIASNKPTKPILTDEKVTDFFQQVFENSAIGKSLTYPDGTIRVNKAFSEMLGYTQDEMVHQRWQKITHPDDIQASTELVAKLLSGNRDTEKLEKRYLHKNGKIVWTAVSTYLQRDSNGDPLFFITDIINITERKQIEAALNESEQKYRVLVENSLVGVLRSNVDGEIIYANDAILRILEYDNMEGLISMGAFIQYKNPAQRTELVEILKRDGQVSGFEANIITKKGNERVLLYSLVLSGDIIDGTLIDITERKRIEREVAESQQFLKTITSEVQAVIFAIDVKGVFTFSDGRGLTKLGLKSGEVVGASAFDVYRDFPEIISALQKSLDGHLIKTDGLEVNHLKYDTTFQPIFNEEGKVFSVVGLAIDVTDAKNSENELRKAHDELASQHALLKAIINSPGDIIILSIDKNYCYTTFNEKHRLEMKKVWNADIQIGDNLLDYMHVPELKALAKNSIDRALHGETFSEIQHQPELNIYYELNWNPILSAKNIVGVTLFIKDITERKQAEERLIFINKAVESTSDAIGIADAQGHHFYQNKALSDLFEYATPEEIEAAGGISIVVKDGEVLKNMFGNIMNGKTWSGELKMVTKSGRVFPAYERADAIKDVNGNIIGLIGVITDITERKRIERKLQVLNETLEERILERTLQLESMNKELTFKNRELEQFTFIASHDLQEPLNTLTNFANYIQEEYAGKLDDDGNKSLEFISGAAKRMSSLVKGLLDYSLLGKDSRKTRVDCNKVVSEVLSDLADSVKESNVKITVLELPDVNGYKSELRILFKNLINNAIKFRKKGILPEIEIFAKANEKDWIFSVRDNGIGIDEKNTEKIFTIFQRLHNRDEYEGIGIGLSHCKKIAELHGGKIWVESNMNGGSTFRFTIPI